MNVALTDEHELLKETAARLADSIQTANAVDIEAADAEVAWSRLARSGLVSLLVPESAGGAGATTLDAALVIEALARRAAVVPFLGCAGLGVALLTEAKVDDSLLAGVAEGRLRVGVAFDASLQRLAGVDEPSVGWDVKGADAVLVLDAQGERLVALDPAYGAPMNSIDLTRTHVRFGAGSPLADIGDVGALVDRDWYGRWLAKALTLLSADLVGVMEGAVELAVDYAKEREQFGVPIGSFQAIQHLCADQKVSLEAARSVMWHGAWSADSRSPSQALEAARHAKAYCSEQGLQVAETTVQVFGGMGVTWECMAHVYLRRAMFARTTAGDEHAQLGLLAAERNAHSG